MVENYPYKIKKAHTWEIKSITAGLEPPIKRKNLDTFYCIKINHLKWQGTTILIQFKYNRLIMKPPACNRLIIISNR